MTDRRRRQKENRAQRRKKEKRAESRREILRRLGFAFAMGGFVVVLFLVLSLFGQKSEKLPGTYQGYRDQPTACGAEASQAESLQTFSNYEPQPDITADVTVTATVSTSCGDFVIRLDPKSSPESVQSFVFLARKDFYAGTVFHRILADFVIQGGDPEATGRGGPGYSIPDEYPSSDFEFEPGVVAMANRGRGTTGSQFFVVVGQKASSLTPNYNILGRVISGQDTLDRIAQVHTATRPNSAEESLPLETVYIEDITIEVG